eukprot:TRINITY_DN49016_c0_g1_i1.p1 TRINITY_DN49016_c0_g1~~TRINITY_DN49016_c0_g1_i1.p1  ORF type:complete len:523 (-),score=88.90 TRINITY_DN49016_c0_g1_i1:114-1652(-)
MADVDAIVARVKDAQAAFWNMNTEDKTMVLGATLCLVLLLGYAFRKICGGRGYPEEGEALKKVGPVVTVTLSRPGNEKLGIAMRPNDEGTCTIMGITDGDLLSQWNDAELCMEKRIRSGDKILSVTNNGKTCSTGSMMTQQLKDGGDVTLRVGSIRSREEQLKIAQCIAGMVQLDGLVLKDAAELAKPTLSTAGALDSVAMEISKVGPDLADWNAKRRAQGSCRTQRLEIGDRIVSIAGNTNVRKQLAISNPTVVMARWVPLGTFRVESFDVTIERQGPDERMGMVICPHPLGTGAAIVLQIAESGAITRWNSSNRQILQGDCIVAVNGFSTYEEMQKALAGNHIALRIERWVEADTPSHSAVGSGPVKSTLPSAKSAVRTPAGFQAASHAGPGLLASIPWQGLSVTFFILFCFLNDEAEDMHLAVRAKAVQLNYFLRMPSQLVPLESQGSLAMMLLAGSLALMTGFLWQEVHSMQKQGTRTTMPQAFIAFLASLFFGYGNFFLLTWAGIYS